MYSVRRRQQCAILQSNRKTHKRARHETSQFLARQNLVVWSLSCFDCDRPWISLFTTINATLLQNIHIIKNKKTFP